MEEFSNQMSQNSKDILISRKKTIGQTLLILVITIYVLVVLEPVRSLFPLPKNVDHRHRFCLLGSEASRNWDRGWVGHTMLKMGKWLSRSFCQTRASQILSLIFPCPRPQLNISVLQQLYTHIVLFPFVACCRVQCLQ